MIGGVWILCRPEKDHHERLAFINHRALGIFLQQRPKIFRFFFESSLAIDILEQDILVDATEQRDQAQSGSQPCPRGVKIASIVADDLVRKTERRSAVLHIFLDEPLAVEDAAHAIGDFAGGRVDAHIFHPGNVLFNHGRVRAVIPATHRLHILRLQTWHGHAGLERHRLRTNPALILHNHDVAVLAHDQGADAAAGWRCRRARRHDQQWQKGTCGNREETLRDCHYYANAIIDSVSTLAGSARTVLYE